MSEAVKNKVRHDTDDRLGSTMYLKYKANNVILLGLQSCVNTVTYKSSAFLGYISSALIVNQVLMMKKL